MVALAVSDSHLCIRIGTKDALASANWKAETVVQFVSGQWK